MQKTTEPLYNKEDIIKIQQYLKQTNTRNYIIFILGINSGLRVSDILSLNIQDIKNKDHITITEQKTQKTKHFPLNKKLQQELFLYTQNKKDTTKPLFMGKKGKRLSRSQVYRFLNEACKVCGIKGNIGTHTMRKTFGLHHYKQFNDVVMLQKIFNHSSQDITLRYIGITQEDINKTYMNFEL